MDEHPPFHPSIRKHCFVSPPDSGSRLLFQKSLTFRVSSAPAELQSALGAQQPLHDFQILLSFTCKKSCLLLQSMQQRLALNEAPNGSTGSRLPRWDRTHQRGQALSKILQPRMLQILLKTKIQTVPAGHRWLLGQVGRCGASDCPSPSTLIICST